MTTNPPVTVTYTLEDLFNRFEQNVNRQIAGVNEKIVGVNEKIAEVNQKIAEVNQKIERQSAEVKQQFNEVNQKIERQSAEFKQQFNEVNQKLVKLEVGQAELGGEIKALDATVVGISKRIDNAEFFNRGVAVALVVAVFGGLVKWFGWIPAT